MINDTVEAPFPPLGGWPIGRGVKAKRVKRN